MKFRDLFVDYCELEGLKIVRVLDLDVFFAVRENGGIAASTILYKLSKYQVEKLKNNELTANELYKDELAWYPLARLEALYEESMLEQIVEDARKEGYFEKTK